VRVRTQGLVALQQDRLDYAQDRFEALVAMTPGEATGYAYLGLVALRRGDLALAEDRIREGLERNDRDPDVHLMLAAVLAEGGDDLTARAVLGDALTFDPAHLGSLWALAELDRGATGGIELERRIESLANLVEAAPANLAARFALATSLVVADRTDRAAGALEGLRQQLPAFPVRITEAFDEALVLLRGGDAPGAASPLDEFGDFFVASGAYQSSYGELRGPERAMVGNVDLTFSHEFSLAVLEPEAVLTALEFVDGSAIAGLAAHPLRGAIAAVALADVDGDGDTDLVSGAADGSGGALHRVDLGTFVDASLGSGLDPALPTEAIAPADFDRPSSGLTLTTMETSTSSTGGSLGCESSATTGRGRSPRFRRSGGSPRQAASGASPSVTSTTTGTSISWPPAAMVKSCFSTTSEGVASRK
jgi:Flp pilus assembly protein TadD